MSRKLTMRSTMKRVIELALVRGGVAGLARSRRAGRVLVLAYHNIVPRGERACGDRSLHLAQEEFAAQLDALGESHDVVPLEHALGAASGAGARPMAVLTFDDAYTGALTAGLEELRRRGLPATIFVAPAFVGGHTFWWDEVAESLGVLDASTREQLLSALRGEDGRVRQWMDDNGHGRLPLPDHGRCADADALAGAVRVPGITLASHTWSHPNLAALTREEIAEEVRRPLQWLRDRFGSVTLPVLSFPYGLASAVARQVVHQEGYRAAMLISGGWMPRAPDPYALPRLDIPAALSENGFRLRASGVIGA